MNQIYPGVCRHKGVRSSSCRRGSIWREGVCFADKGVVAFIVDSGMDEPTDHAPSAIS